MDFIIRLGFLSFFSSTRMKILLVRFEVQLLCVNSHSLVKITLIGLISFNAARQ